MKHLRWNALAAGCSSLDERRCANPNCAVPPSCVVVAKWVVCFWALTSHGRFCPAPRVTLDPHFPWHWKPMTPKPNVWASALPVSCALKSTQVSRGEVISYLFIYLYTYFFFGLHLLILVNFDDPNCTEIKATVRRTWWSLHSRQRVVILQEIGLYRPDLCWRMWTMVAWTRQRYQCI